MDRLAELRESQALTLRDLAERSGVDANTINQVELGHRKPRPSTLRKLAKALDVDVREFFEEPVPLGEAPGEAGPPESDYGAILKELGYPREQIEAWEAEERTARNLEKMSAKDLLETLIASRGALRTRDYYRDNDATASKPPRSETA